MAGCTGDVNGDLCFAAEAGYVGQATFLYQLGGRCRPDHHPAGPGGFSRRLATLRRQGKLEATENFQESEAFVAEQKAGIL